MHILDPGSKFIVSIYESPDPDPETYSFGFYSLLRIGSECRILPFVELLKLLILLPINNENMDKIYIFNYPFLLQGRGTTALLWTCGEPAASWQRCGPGFPYYRSAPPPPSGQDPLWFRCKSGPAFYLK
jgi:hypothetical protein